MDGRTDVSSGCRVETWPEVDLQPSRQRHPLGVPPPRQQTRIVMMKNLNAITGRHKDPLSLRSAHVSSCTRQRLPLQQKVPARGKKNGAQIKNHVMRVSTLSFIASWTHWASEWRAADVRALRTCESEPRQVISGETQYG